MQMERGRVRHWRFSSSNQGSLKSLSVGEGGREGGRTVEEEERVVLTSGDDGGVGTREEPGTHLLRF